MGFVARARRASDWLLGHLHVGSVSTTELPQIDGLRALALSLVVVVHVWGTAGEPSLYVALPLVGTQVWLSEWLRRGVLGVPFFFAISAFLLSQPFLRAAHRGGGRPSLGSYFRRRVLRIVPAYYASLFFLLLLIAPALIPLDRVYSWSGLRELVAHLTFTHALFIETHASWGIDGPMWTLTHEATFYLILPFVAWLFVGRRTLVSLPMALVLTLVYLYLARNSLGFLVALLRTRVEGDIFFSDANIRSSFLAPQFPSHLFSFAVGLAVGDLFVRAQLGLVRRPGPLLALASFLAGSLIIPLAIHFIDLGEPTLRYYIGTPIEAAGFALMLAGLVFGAPAAVQVFSFAPVRVLGIISYSAFLWHVPILALAKRLPSIEALPPGERLAPLAIWALPLVLVLSVASYVFVEKPFLVAARRRRPEPAPAAVTPSPAAFGEGALATGVAEEAAALAGVARRPS